MANARVARGRATEQWVADWFASHGWPYAERNPASLSGCDVLGMPGLAPEVKARRGFNPTEWLRQALKRTGLAFVVLRPDGWGPERLAAWPVILRLEDFTLLLREAGYGSDDLSDWPEFNGETDGTEDRGLIDVPDQELPGMWSRSDFLGGQTDCEPASLAARLKASLEA